VEDNNEGKLEDPVESMGQEEEQDGIMEVVPDEVPQKDEQEKGRVENVAEKVDQEEGEQEKGRVAEGIFQGQKLVEKQDYNSKEVEDNNEGSEGKLEDHV